MLRKLVAGLVLAVSIESAFAAPPTAAPASQPADAERFPGDQPLAVRITKLQQYYAGLYSDPLKSKNRLSKCVAILSLSRIDGEPLTEKLLLALKDKDPLVQQLAWEAVRARQDSLSRDQRNAWITTGLELAWQNGFEGPSLGPVVAAAASRPASVLKYVPELLQRLAEENDPGDDAGKIALTAGRDAVATWRDPKIVQTLAAGLKKGNLAPRIAYLLSGLDGAPPVSDDVAAMKTAYTKFAQTFKAPPATTKPTTQSTATAPTTTSPTTRPIIRPLVDKPEAIDNPEDPKWRKELELSKLTIDSVELAVCIDATPSMAESNPFVAAYLETTARVLGVMSDTVRVGIVYYRHEIDPAIQIECCKKWASHTDDFAVKALALNPDPRALIKQMLAEKIGGRGTGHFGNGAYAAGIDTAMNKIQWSPKGKRVIACTGDATATPGSEQALVTLAQQAKKDGYILQFVARDKKAANAMNAASVAASGLEPILYGSDIDALQAKDKRATASSAITQFAGTAFEAMAIRVIQSQLPPDYATRVGPLVRVVRTILEDKQRAAKAKALAAVG